jgi:hypothetical protein|tara:strand:- start:559 stop:714 length:156 start_codon:yes stop_codon:yes gene_type:complete
MRGSTSGELKNIALKTRAVGLPGRAGNSSGRIRSRTNVLESYQRMLILDAF